MLLIDPKKDPVSVATTMLELEKRYLATNNPIYPMYAFRHCFERDFGPPEWVMKYVALSFHDYLSNSGAKAIETCFQLKVGRGQTPPFKLFLLEERDEKIAWDMFRLVELIGYSVENAAAMVKAKLEETDWNKTRMELSELTEETIRDMYRKQYRKEFKKLLLAGDLIPEDFTDDKRRKFLATFPAHSIRLD